MNIKYYVIKVRMFFLNWFLKFIFLKIFYDMNFFLKNLCISRLLIDLYLFFIRYLF